MNKTQTSRTSLFDTEVRIANLEAIIDHYLEQLIDLKNFELTDYPDGSGGTVKVADPDNIKRQGSIRNQIQIALSIRRNLMSLLEEEYSTNEENHKEWCNYKHSRAEFGIAKEDYLAHLGTDKEDRYFNLLIKSSKLHAGSTSLFTGVEYETCSRCLADKIQKA